MGSVVASSRLRVSLLAVAGMVVSTFLNPVSAQTVQGVAVLVNDQPISNFDIEQRIKLLRASTGRASNARLREEVIQQLIDETIKLQEATRLGIQVPSEQIDATVSQMAKQSKMSMSQFKTALGQIGINLATLRSRVEAEIAWRDAVTARFQSTVRVSEQDVELALGQQDAVEETTRIEFSLQKIMFLIRPGSPRSVVQGRLNEAKLVRRDFRSCDTARSLMVGMRDVVIKDLKNVAVGTLPAATQSALEGLQVGQITPAQNVRQGVVLYGVCERKEITDTQAARTQVQRNLLNQEYTNLAVRYLRDLRQDAMIERR